MATGADYEVIDVKNGTSRTTPDSTDALVAFNKSTGALEQIDYDKLAKAIIENYAGSTLAGSAQSIQNAISNLNSKLTDSGWQETATSGITYRKLYGSCFVRFNLVASLTTTLTQVGTLPSAVAPNYMFYSRCIGSNGVGDVTVVIGDTGIIRARVDSGTGTAINGFIVFDLA